MGGGGTVGGCSGEGLRVDEPVTREVTVDDEARVVGVAALGDDETEVLGGAADLVGCVSETPGPGVT